MKLNDKYGFWRKKWRRAFWRKMIRRWKAFLGWFWEMGELWSLRWLRIYTWNHGERERKRKEQILRGSRKKKDLTRDGKIISNIEKGLSMFARTWKHTWQDLTNVSFLSFVVILLGCHFVCFLRWFSEISTFLKLTVWPPLPSTP